MKKLIIFLSLLIPAISFAQGVYQPTGDLKQTGNYPIIWGKNAKGVPQSRATKAQMLAIPTSFRDTSMTCYVIETDSTYRLQANLTSWVAIAPGNVASALKSINDALVNKVDNSSLAIAGGIATLDNGGKIPMAQLPASLFIYKGMYNAATNTPLLSDATGVSGYTYQVNVAGTHNFGSGNIVLNVGDYVIHNGSVWQKSAGTGYVTSVNNKQGVVSLNTDDITEGNSQYFTNARAIGATLTSFVSAPGTISSSDNILQALQKLAGNQVTYTASSGISLTGSNFTFDNTYGDARYGKLNNSNTWSQPQYFTSGIIQVANPTFTTSTTISNTSVNIRSATEYFDFRSNTLTYGLNAGNNTTLSFAPVTGSAVITVPNAQGTLALTNQLYISPLTALGDIAYRGSTSDNRLPGNTTTVQKFLTQTGTGSASAAPAYYDLFGSANFWGGVQTFNANPIIKSSSPSLTLTETNNNYNTVISKNPTLNQVYLTNQLYQAGGQGSAIKLNGTTQYGLFGNVTQLPANTTTFTVQQWITTGAIGNEQTSFYIGAGSTSPQFRIQLSSTGAVRAIYGGSTAPIGSTTLLPNTYYNIAVTMNGNVATLYINNVSQGTKTFSWTGLAQNGTNAIGVTNSNSVFSNYFQGSIDQTLVYNRILTPTEIATNYNGGYGTVSPVSSGLVSRWEFDDATGTSAIDNSGNGYTISFTNTPAWDLNGKIAKLGAIQTGTGFSFVDGVNNSEKGQWMFGDPQGGFIAQGKSFRVSINGFLPTLQGLDGHIVFDPTITTSLPDVNGSYNTSSIFKLGAGTSTVAPFQFTPGPLTTIPIANALEMDGNNVYITSNSGTRSQIATAANSGLLQGNNTWTGANVFNNASFKATGLTYIGGSANFNLDPAATPAIPTAASPISGIFLGANRSGSQNEGVLMNIIGTSTSGIGGWSFRQRNTAGTETELLNINGATGAMTLPGAFVVQTINVNTSGSYYVTYNPSTQQFERVTTANAAAQLGTGGGSGIADPTTTPGDILVRGSSSLQRLGIGSNNLPLVSNGSTLTYRTLPEAGGGTGQTSYAAGDILYATGTNTLSKLGVGSNGQVLTIVSGAPSWSTPGNALSRNIRVVNNLDITFNSTDYTVCVFSDLRNSTATLPAISSSNNGQILVLKRTDANSTTTVTLQATGTDYIYDNNVYSTTKLAPYTGAITVQAYYNSSNPTSSYWVIVSNN